MKPAIIKINLHQNHPWTGWAADVWRDDELRITGYGDDKAEAVEKARSGYRMCIRTRRRFNMATDVEINHELVKALCLSLGVPREVGCSAEDYFKLLKKPKDI